MPEEAWLVEGMWSCPPSGVGLLTRVVEIWEDGGCLQLQGEAVGAELVQSGKEKVRETSWSSQLLLD